MDQPSLEDKIKALGLSFPPLHTELSSTDYIEEVPSTLRVRYKREDTTHTLNEGLPELPLDIHRKITAMVGGLAQTTSKTMYNKQYRKQNVDCWLGVSIKEIKEYLSNPNDDVNRKFGFMIVSKRETGINISLATTNSIIGLYDEVNVYQTHIFTTRERYNYRENKSLSSLFTEITSLMNVTEDDILYIMPDINTHNAIMMKRVSCGIYAEGEAGVELYYDMYVKRMIEEATYLITNPYLMIYFLMVTSINIIPKGTKDDPSSLMKLSNMLGEAGKYIKYFNGTHSYKVPDKDFIDFNNFINKIVDEYIRRFGGILLNVNKKLSSPITITTNRNGRVETITLPPLISK